MSRISTHMVKCPDMLISEGRSWSTAVKVTSDRLSAHSDSAITKDNFNEYFSEAFVNVINSMLHVINSTPPNIEHKNGHLAAIPHKPRASE